MTHRKLRAQKWDASMFETFSEQKWWKFVQLLMSI